MPEVRPVTKDNWNELIELKVRPDQEHFVTSNLSSIAETQFVESGEMLGDDRAFSKLL